MGFIRTSNSLRRRFSTHGGHLPHNFLGVKLRRTRRVYPSYSSHLDCRTITTEIFLRGFRVTVPHTVNARVARLHLRPALIEGTLFRATTRGNIRLVRERQFRVTVF